MTHDDKMPEIVALLRRLTEDGRIEWEQTTHDRTGAVARLGRGGVRLYPGLRYSLDLLDDAGKVESTYTPAGADAEALAALYGLVAGATRQDAGVVDSHAGMADSVLAELRLRARAP